MPYIVPPKETNGVTPYQTPYQHLDQQQLKGEIKINFRMNRHHSYRLMFPFFTLGLSSLSPSSRLVSRKYQILRETLNP